jgi:hypothetical protein
MKYMSGSEPHVSAPPRGHQDSMSATERGHKRLPSLAAKRPRLRPSGSCWQQPSGQADCKRAPRGKWQWDALRAKPRIRTLGSRLAQSRTSERRGPASPPGPPPR